MLAPFDPLSDADVQFIFTQAFDGEILMARVPGPKRRVELDLARIRLEAVALAIAPRLKGKPWLRAGHMTEPTHIRKHYPPPRLGAFLARFRVVSSFADLAGLRDKDPEGWVGTYHHGLTCPVLYSDLPRPFLVFLAIGDDRAISTAAKSLLEPARVRDLLRRHRRAL